MTTGAVAFGAGALTFALDDVGVTFLVLFAVLWTLSGVYAWVTVPAAERGRLFAWYVPAALGGVAVALAADAVSFYLCFALMALPSWGLVTHTRTEESRRAGAIYLIVTVLGEALLLGALMLLAARAGSLDLGSLRAAAATMPLALGLLVGAIALKIGALPASGVLPLTYLHAPAGAAAALAGASVKVGALAMLRLLPLGSSLPQWQTALIVLGFATAFGAAALGLFTTSPRAVLGYSSASQMGLVTVAAGVGLGSPEAGALATGAIVAYSIHHGLAKSALVLGDDVAARTQGRGRVLALVGLLLPALALVGAPLTSGFVAKYALKDAIHALDTPLAHTVELLLPWAAVATAALMLRFVVLVRARPAAGPSRAARPAAAIWGVLLVAVASATWLWPATWAEHAAASAFKPASLWPAIWPLLIALAAGVLIARLVTSERLRQGILPPGDLLLALAAGVRGLDAAIGSRVTTTHDPAAASPQKRPLAALARALVVFEGHLVVWAVASVVFVALVVAVVLLATT